MGRDFAGQQDQDDQSEQTREMEGGEALRNLSLASLPVLVLHWHRALALGLGDACRCVLNLHCAPR